MNPNLVTVREKVQRFLADSFGTVQVTADGELSIRHESARVLVNCWTHGDDAAVFVNITCPVLFQVKETPALFEYIATHADDKVFGHLHARRFDDGISVFNSHTLLGDYLDQQELESACLVVLMTANELDDELQAQFGGTRFHED